LWWAKSNQGAERAKSNQIAKLKAPHSGRKLTAGGAKLPAPLAREDEPGEGDELFPQYPPDEIARPVERLSGMLFHLMASPLRGYREQSQRSTHKGRKPIQRKQPIYDQHRSGDERGHCDQMNQQIVPVAVKLFVHNLPFWSRQRPSELSPAFQRQWH
jgi:hypothetical protein